MKTISTKKMAFRHFLLVLNVLAITVCLQTGAIAQGTNLPPKATLSQTVLSNKTFTNATAVDTVIKPYTLATDYTLEVIAKVTSATGRGLDIETRNGTLKGVRVSLDAAQLKVTSTLTAAKIVSASNAAENHVIRVAVLGDSAHIYQNGAYLLSQKISLIKDVMNGVETDQLTDTATGPNLASNWAGSGGAGKPSDYGWANSSGSTTLFATANSTVAGTSRYMDVNAASGGNLHTLNGSTYIGRLLYVRWDNSSIQNSFYSYPVTLEANTSYDFSMLHAYVSNASGTNNMTVGIGKLANGTDRYDSKIFYPTGTRTLKREDFYFTSREAGVYYITITSNWALYSIGELSVRKVNTTPRFLFGKNYPTGAVDMEVISATYEDGAWAPAALVTQPRQTVTLTGASVQIPTTFNTNFVVPGKTDVHFNAENTPFVNSGIALNANDAWLFLDNVRPGTAISNWLSMVTINGSPAVNGTNVRIAVYKNGVAIIPNGNQTNASALQVFTQPNLGGTAQTYPIETVHNNLGVFNNSIRSFKLKRGYMATLANSADGSGYSRVFIANDSDLVVNAMPVGLDTTVSFVRVLKWNWPTKKGKAGWNPDKIGATWYYDWNIAGNSSSPNYDYAAIRQTQYWPGFGDMINKPNLNHVLGFNEPDRPDQANMTVEQAFTAWPQLMQTGLRIGSPAPATPSNSWITDFLKKTDSLNYRVDFVAIHCYWGGQTPQQWYSQLKAIYDRVKRPLWITEWNNGANWTTETWPTNQAAQFQKQLNDMMGILNVLDTTSFIERYAEYDWVENKRALVLADTLTPAGKYYFANKSDFAYNPSKAFVHTWKLAAPYIYSSINNADYFRTTLTWAEPNGELGSKYILERKIDGRDADFVTVQEFNGYTLGANMSYTDSVYGRATYRIKAYAKDGVAFTYSNNHIINGDATPVAPSSLTGTVISATRIQLNWNAGTNVRSYNLKRSLSATGPWDTIAARTTALTFLDTALTPNITYYYVVTTLNSAGESANSSVLTKATPALVAPVNVLNPRIASGDSKVTLTWDFQFDAKYKVLRSASTAGPFDTVIANLQAMRYEDGSRANNTTVYYRVIAFNEVGTSAPSAVLEAKPQLGRHLYINFDDTTSALAADEWGGYHATLMPAATRDTGQLFTGLKLDGTANSYAVLNNGIPTAITNFTVATWVKMNALTNWMRIFDFGTGSNKYMFLTPQANATGGTSSLRYVIKNGGTEQILNYGHTWALNTWTHIAITQSADSTKLYINGTQVASTAGITIRPTDLGGTNLNYIGKSQFSADAMLNGSVDEFKIFNYALSAQNVANLYSGNPLPITFEYLKGTKTNSGNLLTWKVNTNSSSIKMELEKSSDSRSFSTIHTISATRNATASPFYFTDAQASGTINYYRLKMTDLDGKVSYSPVVAITNAAKGIELVGAYPTLVNNSAYVSISSSKDAAVKLVITDIFGRTMQVTNKMVVAGSNLLNIDASALASGTYSISAYQGNERMGTIRFVVNR